MNNDKLRIMAIRFIRFLINRTIGVDNLKNCLKRFIIILARLGNINLLYLAYNNMGILKFSDDSISGENFVISCVIPKTLNKNNLILFDIGANIGDYSKKLRLQFSNAKIYAFEPNTFAYQVMQNNVSSLEINCYNLGLSSELGAKKIYDYATEKGSQHASLYKKVLTDLHCSNDIVEIEFITTTIDTFCKENNINAIDFMKIDTEGHEYEILQGAKQMLVNNAVKIIQFEFNEMNILSRVFLKDFYDYLPNYLIYRLDSNALIPIFTYSSDNEIFKYQNLLAINKNYSEDVTNYLK